MAVTTGTINVNSGNASWTRAHVMNALETLFGSSHLNWNSGTQQTGVPVCCLYPGHDGTAATQDNLLVTDAYESRLFNGSSLWARCGGAVVPWTAGGADAGHDNGKNGYSATRYLYVTNNGTTSYLVQDELIPATNGVSSNVITLSHSLGSNLTTGTKVTYNGQGTNSEKITGLTVNNVYYMRRVGPNKITLHNSSSDATNNQNIVSCTSTSFNQTNAKRFRTDTAVNPTITVKRGEKLYWYDHAVTQGNFKICDVTTTSGAYDAERVLTDSSKLGHYVTTAISGSGTFTDPYYWETENYPQTETEVYNPQKVSGTGHTGLHSYGYCNDAQSNLKGSVVILPDHNYEMRTSSADGFRNPYWKVTISGSQGDTDNSGSGRTNIKLRVHRDTYSTNEGGVSAITVHNVATGWSAGDVFTIPGEDIGGAATTNDITFGTNAYTSGTNNTPSIIVTNHGAGNNMFQKHPSGDFGILRMENDASKTFGTTYWGFAIDDNNYNMFIRSGCAWQTLNSLGTNCDSTGSDEEQYGVFGGDVGLDVQLEARLDRTPSTADYYTYLRFATTNSPTSYPLKIKYFRAPNTQDNNFVVIQFIQEISSVDEPFACFTLHRGSTFGSNVWDLDHVWNGTYTEYKTQYQEGGNSSSQRDRWIDMKYWTPAHAQYNSAKPNYEPPNWYSLAREASYGYLRNSDNNTARAYADVRYSPNIMTHHETDSDTAEVYTYYRDQTLDKATAYSADTGYGQVVNVDLTNSVSSSAAYYKPIKGIPINNRFAPCPYYIPDDFVFIQVEVTPPATVFRPGDTVTVAAGEVYTIINCDNQINQDGLDGGSNNVAVGMLFAARTT